METIKEKWNAGQYCVVCGSPYVQKHHIFSGSKRKFAEKYGYIIPLCMTHHTGDEGIHLHGNSNALALSWKRKAQQHYEAHYGTREDFIRECGKSYL